MFFIFYFLFFFWLEGDEMDRGGVFFFWTGSLRTFIKKRKGFFVLVLHRS